MAAKGSQAKAEITNKILEVFSGAFVVDGKEIRIPCVENGETVQIKIALTAAKVNVDNPAGDGASVQTNVPVENKATEANLITQDEKESVEAMLERLGL